MSIRAFSGYFLRRLKELATRCRTRHPRHTKESPPE